jgi:hypothetical protein
MSELVRHCYLVQTHREPRQVLRLVRALRRGSPSARIFVYHDGSRQPFDPALLSPLSGCDLLLAPVPVRRAEFSMVEAYLDAAERIARRGVEYEWLTLLSGQDYPLRPLADYERHLDRSGVQGFLRYGDVLGPDTPWPKQRRRGHRRYFYRYRTLSAGWLPWLSRLRWLNQVQSLVHLQLTYGAQVGCRLLRPPFDGGVRCYAGPAWHSLSRECVAYLLERHAAGDPLVEHFRHTTSPEEAFCQTLLVNSGRFRLANDNLRFADFTGSVGGSPRTLTVADLPWLLESPCYFARKFDVAVDEEVLDRLDERLLGASSPLSPCSGRPLREGRSEPSVAWHP